LSGVVNLVYLVREVVELIRAHRVGEAISRMEQAERNRDAEDFRARQAVVHETNRALVEVKAGKEEVLNAIRALPPTERFDAEHGLLLIIDRVFDEEINRLRIKKRQHSRPRGRQPDGTRVTKRSSPR